MSILLALNCIATIAFCTSKDSLKILLHNSQNDTAKVNLFNSLALDIFHTELDTAILYADNAIALAKGLKFVKGEARGYHVKGRILLEQARNKDCVQYFQRALGLYEGLDGVANLVGDSRLSLGRAYDLTGDYFNSLDQFQKSINAYRSVSNSKGAANSLVNIGIIHDRMKDHVTALNYYKQAETEYKKIKDSTGLVYIYNNIGYIDYQLEDYESAITNYSLGIDLAEKTDFEYMLPFLFNNLGGVYNDLGKTKEAEISYQKANAFSTKMKNKDGIVNSLMALASINYKERNFDEHLEKILWSYEESKQQGNKSLIQQTSKLLSEMYDFKGDKSKAYAYLAESFEMQDSLNSTSLIQETSGLETQYQLEKMRSNEQRELEKRDRQILGGVIFFLAFSTFFLSFLYLKNRENKAKDALNSKLIEKNEKLVIVEQNLEARNKELEKYIESNIQLEQFAHFASHDLKTPLRTIASFTGLLKHNLSKNKDEKIDTYVRAIETGAKRMNSLVVDLLDYSKVNSQLLNIDEFSFGDICKEVKENLKYVIDLNKVKLHVANDELTLMADRSKIKQVLENLVNNAVKFSSKVDFPEISINAELKDAEYLISVTDNGIGIESKYHEEIFDTFKQLHAKSKYEGSGLGLAICKNIVEKHGGKIWVESTLGEGTSMHFSIPKRN